MFEPELDVEKEVVAWIWLALVGLGTAVPLFESGELPLPSMAERIVYSKFAASDPSEYDCAEYGPNMESG